MCLTSFDPIELIGCVLFFVMRCHCFSYLCFNFIWSLDLPHYIHFSQFYNFSVLFFMIFSCLLVWSSHKHRTEEKKKSLKSLHFLYLMLWCNRINMGSGKIKTDSLSRYGMVLFVIFISIFIRMTAMIPFLLVSPS